METKNNYIDLTYLKELSNGSNEFITQMISIFMEQTPEALTTIDKHLQSKDWQSLRAVVHKIKPSFAFMGVHELENTIAVLEDYCANQTHLDQIPELISKIKTISLVTLKELEKEKLSFI